MKEERMKILSMLENGTITAQEAQDLLQSLNCSKSKEETITKAFESTCEKVSHLLNRAAKKAEKIQPKVKATAEKTAEKMSQAANTILDDAKTYMEKRREQKAAEEEEWASWDTEDFYSNTPTPDDSKAETTPEPCPESDACLKNLEAYMNTVEMQLSQLDDAEAYLREAFGEEEDFETEVTVEDVKPVAESVEPATVEEEKEDIKKEEE